MSVSIRHILPAFLFLSCVSPLPLMAASFETDSTLKAATVYTNRATLTRQATIDIPAGEHNIIFEGLPANLMPDSLRIEGSAAADVIFGALSHKHVIQQDLTVPREKELNDKIEALQDQKKIVQAEKQALQTQKIFLDNIGKQASLRTNEDIAEINLKPEQWAAAAETVHSGSLAILKAQITHDLNLRKMDREIQKLQREMNQLRTGQRSTYQVTVPLESSSPTKLTVDISYQLSGASWRPLYDARLDTEKGDLELIQYGAVRQNTGEDWSDIKLTLSTAQPHRGAGQPALSPMWVNIWESSPGRLSKMRQERSNMMVGSVSSMDMPMAAMEMEENSLLNERKRKDATFRAATINTGGFVSEYEIVGLSSVASDGTESKLMIGGFETESDLQIQVKPQMSNKAFLVSHAKLLGEAPILPGTASLFRDGAYVGQTHLPLLRPDEEQDLSFGIDDQVSVKRSVMKDESGESGLIAKDSVVERYFTVDIKNLHNRPVKLVVLETIPTGQDEKIRVEIVKDKTTAGYKKDYEDVKGLLRWQKDMKAKENYKINLGWKVSWPKDHSINGL